MLKDANRAELMLAIRTVSAGQQFLCKAIARALTLSVKTVEKHRSNLMRKLHLHNAAAITMFAVRNGLMSADQAPGANAMPVQSISVG